MQRCCRARAQPPSSAPASPSLWWMWTALILESGGSDLAVAICAAGLALADAGIPFVRLTGGLCCGAHLHKFCWPSLCDSCVRFIWLFRISFVRPGSAVQGTPSILPRPCSSNLTLLGLLTKPRARAQTNNIRKSHS